MFKVAHNTIVNVKKVLWKLLTLNKNKAQTTRKNYSNAQIYIKMATLLRKMLSIVCSLSRPNQAFF